MDKNVIKRNEWKIFQRKEITYYPLKIRKVKGVLALICSECESEMAIGTSLRKVISYNLTPESEKRNEDIFWWRYTGKCTNGHSLYIYG
jgi:hypothetical protein